ncbi:NucA/NucB deoxyribonuclease domain-containing protein [Burkholderia gladioli]|uniref:NucA/NucB deoxyribonuclease domain-containing protein n=1 Tax=Burkholderia gladioli TaxID=28095 RepID=UPI001FC8B0E6|nr:NucA/NucB deoxyribonuclease domain-containing protein [Burkholderia gladioli]
MNYGIRWTRPLFVALLGMASALAHAESATDVSPICTTVSHATNDDDLLSRGSHCFVSDEQEYVVKNDQNAEIGRVGFLAYTYSDNPLNQLSWTLKFRFRARVISGNPSGVMIKPVVECGSACTVAPNAGVTLMVGGLSAEENVTLTPNLGDNNPLRFTPSIEIRAVKTGESFDNGPSLAFYGGVTNVSQIRCDVGLAKAGTQGCVYERAPAVLRTITLGNPDVDESARHILEAQQEGLPGRFVSRGDGTIFADSSASPLTRLRDASLRASNRAASKAQCVAKFGAVTGQCTFTGDPDEVPSDCDCDEYPFAATNEGAAFGNVSVKRIDASDNRRAGAFLGNFYLNQRVLDGDPFFVEVGSASAKR